MSAGSVEVAPAHPWHRSLCSLSPLCGSLVGGLPVLWILWILWIFSKSWFFVTLPAPCFSVSLSLISVLSFVLSFVLFVVGLFCSSSSGSLRWRRRLLIGDVSSLLTYAFRSLTIFVSTALVSLSQILTRIFIHFDILLKFLLRVPL